jgi:Lrp/AsnC family transcriptional regulator, regulator for asnA, asnC and gidA
MMKVDKMDQKIIDCLKSDGRMPNNEIAVKLSVSEGTVRNRIRKLTKNGFMKVKGLIDPNQITEKQVIFIGAKVAVSKDLEKAAETVSKLPNVNSTSVVTGRFDLIIELFTEPYAVINFICNDLGKLDSIISTESFLTLKNYDKWI